LSKNILIVSFKSSSVGSASPVGSVGSVSFSANLSKIKLPSSNIKTTSLSPFLKDK
jgi:hypothetical protein